MINAIHEHDPAAGSAMQLLCVNLGMAERAFALAPLLELVPDAADPYTRERYVVPPGDVRLTGDVL